MLMSSGENNSLDLLFYLNYQNQNHQENTARRSKESQNHKQKGEIEKKKKKRKKVTKEGPNYEAKENCFQLIMPKALNSPQYYNNNIKIHLSCGLSTPLLAFNI